MPTTPLLRRRSAAHRDSQAATPQNNASSSVGNGHGTETVPLDSVIINDELARRPAPQPRYEAENRAYLAMAQAAAESPQRLFDRLAETALELCQAHSAGISLLDESRKRFYWPVIVGKWASHVGGGTPADFGPCGTVLERNAAQLFRRPERHFGYLAPVEPHMEEALLIPFYANGAAVGTIWVMAHDETRRFDSEDLRLMTNLAGFASAAYRIVDAAREEELAGALHLQRISAQLIQSGNTAELYEKILDAAAAIMRSEFASMQMLDAGRGELRLLAFRGFHPDSAKFWEWVRPASGSTCGRAMATRQRVVVSDTETCEFMAGTEDMHFYRRSKIRAVQSTPLLSRSGELLGMVSTHWKQPHNPTERELRLFDILARQAADLIERVRSEEVLRRSNELLEERVQTRTRELEAQICETRRAEEGLRAVTERLFKLQDDERRHIARELHAGASQALAALSMSLGRLTKVATRIEELELIDQCHALIESITREIRTISYVLHPPLLEELGLSFALRSYAQGFSERSGILVRVENEKLLEKLPDDSEIAVFRVIQESLSNIHRHSGATQASIRVAECAGGLQLTIADNGKGLSEGKQRELAESARAGVGILGMRERIRQLGGTLEIVSGVPSADPAVDFAEAFSLRSRGASADAGRGREKPKGSAHAGEATTSAEKGLDGSEAVSAPKKLAQRIAKNKAKQQSQPGTCVSVIVPIISALNT